MCQDNPRLERAESPVGPNGRKAAFVSVENLVKHYPLSGGRRHRKIRAVDGVSFSMRQGEILGLVGESGCGKSTIARLLVRLLPATSGSVTIDDRQIFELTGEELRRMRRAMQMVFQDPVAALDPRMRVGTSMEAPLAQHRMGQDRGERRQLVLRMLAEIGLDSSFYDRYPHQCSGGQLQRVVIGRALLLRPSFLVCDEPTSALDASMRTQILSLLLELKKRFGLTLLMISHDLRVVHYLCDRIAVMYLGQIVEMAERDELFANPRHPYTRALITSSMIEEDPRRSRGMMISGEPPSPLNPPTGCRFHPRCLYAEDMCHKDPPRLEEAGPTEMVRCHLWAKIDFSSQSKRGDRGAPSAA